MLSSTSLTSNCKEFDKKCGSMTMHDCIHCHKMCSVPSQLVASFRAPPQPHFLLFLKMPAGVGGLSKVDLAILTNDGLKKIASARGIDWSKGVSRVEIIGKLREAGYDKYADDSQQGTNVVSVESELRASIKALQDTVSELREQLLAITTTVKSCPEQIFQFENVRKDISAIREAFSKADIAPGENAVRALSGSDESVATTGLPLPSASTSPVSTYAETAARAAAKKASAQHPRDPYSWSLVTHKRHSAKLNALSSKSPELVSERGLESATRIKRSEFFLGGIGLDSTAADVKNYCYDRSVSLTSVRLFPSKKFYGTLCARFAVDSAHKDDVCTDDFWPTGITVRPWVYPNASEGDSHPTPQ